ncbi:hypothetical protein ACIO14_09125 [Nocardia fluminea]
MAEQMIRFSDDSAAQTLSGKYPGAITAVAADVTHAMTPLMLHPIGIH